MIDVSKIEDKIRKLLRLAKGREDEPEGETALRLAQELMTGHGIGPDQVSIEDEDKDVDEVWIVQAEAPVPWMEMLLVALCDVNYGGVVMPMVGPAGWRLYVVADRGQVDIANLQNHYDYLSSYVSHLSQDFEALLIEEGKYAEKKVSSFSMGIVAGITEMLFMEIGGYVPREEHMPFVVSKALTPSREEPNAIQKPFESFQHQVDTNNAIFRQTHPPVESPPSSKETVNTPDWNYYDLGRRAAYEQIDDVFPPEEATQATR